MPAWVIALLWVLASFNYRSIDTVSWWSNSMLLTERRQLVDTAIRLIGRRRTVQPSQRLHLNLP